MPDLIPLAQMDCDAVENLLDAAFGDDRHGRTAYILRQGSDPIPALSYAIVGDGQLIASIQCWPVRVGSTRLVLVGPVAVAPERQGEGFGHRLMLAALDAAKTMGDPAMVMVGDPEYYGRFGFTDAATGGWTLPGPWEPRRLLARNVAGHDLPPAGMVESDDAL